jgi:predicted acylesterase/phospholipase RssA
MGQAAKNEIEIGIVLQGGGALGAYEFGAIIALLELMDAIDVPGRKVSLVTVAGVSIGAINAACVVGTSAPARAMAGDHARSAEVLVGGLRQRPRAARRAGILHAAA